MKSKWLAFAVAVMAIFALVKSTGARPMHFNAPPTSTPTPSMTQAIRVNDFQMTQSVVTHHIQGQETTNADINAINYLGVRGHREDATGDTNLQSDLCTINSSTNDHAWLDLLPIYNATNETIAQVQAMYDSVASCGLHAVEGPNEPNNFNFVYRDQACGPFDGGIMPSAGCAVFMADLYAMAHKDYKLAGIPVWGMTEVGSEGENEYLQDLKVPTGSHIIVPDGTVYADAANVHNYIGGNGNGLVIDNQVFWTESIPVTTAWQPDLFNEYWGNGTWNRNFPMELCTPPSYSNCQYNIHKVTTETGWAEAQGTTAQQKQMGYMLADIYLQGVRMGFDATTIYRAFNTSGDNAEGMFNVNGDEADSGNALPAANYIHNMNAIIHDTNSTFTPGTLNYSISGMPSTGYSLLMEKGNGTWELAVWGESFSSNTSTSLTVNLGSTFSTVSVYDVTSGTSPVQTHSNVSSVTLSINQWPNIVEAHN